MAILEILMGALVLGIALIGLALLLSSGRTFVLAQGNERVALHLANEKIEEIKDRARTEGFAMIQIETVTEPPISAGRAGGQSFKREWSIECVDDDDLDSVIPCPSPILTKRITVTVTPESMRQAIPVRLRAVLTTSP